ncbi:hypothetical protein [Hymenobacter rigui]|uniref:Uncharacterized protein n=1 Tax=Hymenobacter rigui TaxID=334424 RepID=A0A3R9NLJ3_9BACT|nr:hypothetical protein [Hymenobacter rigui]RSK49849.1 hypothetical protein EI291_04170 [Hymenobacter rigui]
MKQTYSFQQLRVAQWLLGGLLLAVASCKNETEVLPDQGPEYYPMEVGAYRIYAVADTSWRNNVPTVSRFQFREQVAAELSPDATGQPVYRVIRSRRATATDSWAADSVLTVTVAKSFVTEQLGNRRTVVMVFPALQGKNWDSNAFNTLNGPLDSARQANRDYQVRNRYYAQTGAALSLQRDGRSYAYDNTVTTFNDLTAANGVNICGTTVLRTTFAKGIGPVYRVRRRYSHDSGTLAGCNPSFIYLGQSRSEVLIESGK